MKMKHILLASLLSVGILSVTQSAQAFKPGSPAALKAGVKVESKVEVFMYLDENDQPIGYEFQVSDPDVSGAIFDLMDGSGIIYQSNSDGDEVASEAAKKKKKKEKKVEMKDADWCAKNPDTCRGSDPANGGSGYWEDTSTKTTSSSSGYKDGGPADPNKKSNPQ